VPKFAKRCFFLAAGFLGVGGWFFSALSFFIKPSGGLVMAAMIGIAAIELIIRYLRHPEQIRSMLKFAAWVLLSCIPVYGFAFWTAFGSDYLGDNTVSAGIKAQGILRLISEREDLTAAFVRFIVPVIGWWWFCPMAFCLILIVLETVPNTAGRRLSAMSLRIVGCLVLASVAIYWWLFVAGTQHRYLFPFILMIIMWLAPSVIERMNGAGATIKATIACYSLTPAFLLVVLLFLAQPPMSLQTAMGINLTTGQYAFEVEVGRHLLSEADRLGRPVNIYSVGNMRVGVVEMMDRVQSIEKGDFSGKFKVRRPLNWVDMPGLRLQEITESDFLIMEDVRPSAPDTAVTSVSNWREEIEQFKQHIYLHHGVDKNGLELLHDGLVKAFRVVRKELLAEDLHVWAASIRWENDFAERNRAFLVDLR
jgi:hypothetical protein